ncbi:SGNH/GDSL hydrolase family protein [Acinetobacter baumannii]|uniref:SGNH/GDSL hydrolase family protein n=1 Tax=Acinetobacter baumannii TaxID=470 RepID=UPI0004531658|nr:SGNH/GDSL hydrolase family protein [Acinetobacter baumannii]EXG15766.1 GDSL-like Lipase/Acylhydrolase family protein [Acinetobacter baumannii 472237-120]EXH09006.1 GDSL-like Lipase/Acylhydrolase family protein [Acinetobacter baumannii 1188188]EXH19569.1 GDSL-like Lipase/Acylhydrolase family protein [Acinetobacter baumannii 1271213]EXI08533.1 GDSL-like Lipase/Acylhydrolase family protein [Acinetobacter baumannii 480175]EXR35946.1 GDSL-like Lipase/Acylhydrolase family protein [Acinetobacter b
MADEIVTRQQLVDAGLDAESLQTFISGSDVEDVLTRLGMIYPTLAKLVRMLMETGGWKAYETEAILLASTPLVNPSVGYAFDTKKLYLWNGTTWKDEGKSPLDVAKSYTDSFSSLTKNSTVYFPLNTSKRNNVLESTVTAAQEAYLKPYILDVTVNDADLTKYYRIQQISNPDHATAPNRWIFEVLNRTNFETAETTERTFTVVFPIVKNTGIKTFTVQDGDITVSVTVDTNKTPTTDFYSVASSDGAYTYYISPSRYFASTLAKSTVYAYIDSSSALTKNATVVYPFSTQKRNNVNESTVPATHIAYLKPYILNIRVMNANKDHYYRVQQISNPDHPTAANRWIFEVLARANFDTAETRVATFTSILPIVKNSGIRTFLVEYGDVKLGITLDTNKCPTTDFYSVASTDNSYTYIFDPSLYYYAAVTSADINAVYARINDFIKPAQLKNLLNDLRNPIQSVQIKLIGDSLTYGLGATDNGGGTPGTHGPATTKTWANLLRDYLGVAFCTSARFGDDTIATTGEAYYTAAGTSVLTSELSNYTFKNSATGKVFTLAEMQALTGINASSPTGTYLDIKSPSLAGAVTDMEFIFNGNEFTINYAKLSNGSETESNIDVFVDDVYHSSFNVYAASAAFGFSTTISGLADGQKKIRIANRLTNTAIYARLVSITAPRKISVINEGVSGWNTGSWLSGDNISNKISVKDNYVIMMLGTNDRQNTLKIGTFKNNYLQLLDRIGIKNPKAQIIIMAPPAVTQSEDPDTTNYKFRIADLNYSLVKIAQLRSLSIINLFEMTSRLKAQGVSFLISDGLHLNDNGYTECANHIISQILNA